MNTKQHGFTIWELMMTVAVAGILLGLGVPSFMEIQRNSAMTAAANELVTGVLLARAEAIKRQQPVSLCTSPAPMATNPACGNTGTRLGFIVWADENGNAVIDSGEIILRQIASPGGTIAVSSDNDGTVTFTGSGFARRAGTDQTSRVLFCDDRGNRATTGNSSAARAVRIAPTGRGQVLQEIGDIDAAITVTNGSCS